MIEKLATGGMAEIYKAKTFGVDGFEKLLAVKRILPQCATDREFIQMLADEAKLLVGFSHTNIVQVYDLGKVENDYFISMEYVDGINLRELLLRLKDVHEPLPEEIAVYILNEICSGLDYAHSRRDSNGQPLGIVHRDISPQNVLLSFEGEVKIVDFGIAKAAMNVSHTLAGVLKGKITYMSPEQAAGKSVDFKTDIYSTGLLLQEVLTGQRVFNGETQLEVLEKIRNAHFTDEDLPKTIHPALRKIILKALEYRREDRYANAGEMQVELSTFLHSNYPGFSRRQFAALLNRIFAKDIEGRRERYKQELTLIDEKTRSSLLSADTQQYLVHREGTQTSIGAADLGEGKTMRIEFQPSYSSNSQGGGPSQPQVSSPKKRGGLWAGMIALLVLLSVVGFFVYQKVFPPVELIGSIEISTEPPGAKIFLNEKDTGLVTAASTDEKPTVLSKVPVQISQKVTLKFPGYVEFEKDVLALPNLPAKLLNIKLEKIPTATLKVQTKPDGAKVFLDDKEIGITPLEIKELSLNKTLNLRLEKEDFRPFEKTVTFSSVEPVVIEKDLEAIPYGAIEIVTDPAGAKIFKDNQDTQLVTQDQLPVRLEKLQMDQDVELLLKLDGHLDFRQTFKIQSQDPIKIQHKFLKPAFVTVNADVAAAVQIDGRYVGETSNPFQIEPGKAVTVTVTKKDYDVVPPSQTITLQSGESKTIEFQLKEKAKPQFATLSVSSDPPGANISVNGDGKGKAPLGGFQVSANRALRVTATLEGYKSETQTVTLRENETRAISFSLTKETTSPPPGEDAFISAKASKATADVFIDGQKVGATPNTFKVKPGSHSVRLACREGEGSTEKSFNLSAGQTGSIEVSCKTAGGEVCEPEEAVISIDSNPSGALVYVNGLRTGETPIDIKGPGVKTCRAYTIKVEKSGYKPKTFSFTLEKKKASYSIKLDKQN